MKKLTRAELEKRGARLVREAEKKASEPTREGISQSTIKEITESISSGNRQLAESLSKALTPTKPGAAKPLSYRVTIERDKRGLMTAFEMHPIEE